MKVIWEMIGSPSHFTEEGTEAPKSEATCPVLIGGCPIGRYESRMTTHSNPLWGITGVTAALRLVTLFLSVYLTGTDDM